MVEMETLLTLLF